MAGCLRFSSFHVFTPLPSHIRFNHRPHYSASDELLGTAETRVQLCRGLSDVKDFTGRCNFVNLS